MLRQIIEHLRQILLQKTPLLLCSLILLHTLLHVKYFSLPPVGFHQWRQTQTLSVARNFYEESMNIFQPRVDSRGGFSGITGMEFPLVNFVIALGYEVFGYSYTLQRVVILLFSAGAIIACYWFSRKLFRSASLAFAAAFFLTFSPLFSYYSIVAMPDVPSLAFVFAALYYLLAWRERATQAGFWVASLLLCVASLIKLSALLLFPIWLWICWDKRRAFSPRLRISYALGAIAILIPVGVWYLYAQHLSELHHNFDFKLSVSFPYSLSIVPEVAKRVFIQWLPELYVNYAEFIFVIIGVFALRRSNTFLKGFLALYLAGLAVFMVAMFPMLEMHDYYMIPALPLLVTIATVGIRDACEWSTRSKSRSFLILLLLLLVPIVGSIRALSRFEGATIEPEMLTIERYLDAVVPDRRRLVIAASDSSPSIYLYFMHRKGWSVTEGISAGAFEDLIRRGARYLVSDSRLLDQRPEIAKDLVLMSTVGKFKIFWLRIP